MDLYDDMIDENGVMIDSRLCIYVKFKDINQDGIFEQYQMSKIITSDKTGVLLIIDEENQKKLHHYKLKFKNCQPKLVERSES